VDDGEDDVGMTLQDVLDGPRQEVLALDPQPFHVTTGEVHVALLVAIPEIAGVETTAARPLGRRLRILVVALEEPCARRVDDLADGGLGVRETTLLVEASGGARPPIVVENLDPRTGEAERSRRIAVVPRERDADLARAVSVDHAAAETACERVDVLPWRLVAVREPQRCVGVVRSEERRVGEGGGL